MALRNGLALVSERHWAAAIREADGTISVASGKKVRIPGSGDGLRGPGFVGAVPPRAWRAQEAGPPTGRMPWARPPRRHSTSPSPWARRPGGR